MRFVSIMVISMTGQHVDQPFLNRPVQYAAVRVTIVVPCYNEEKRLDTKAFLDFRFEGHDLEFLFANDGSRDGTLHVIESLRAADPTRFDVFDGGVNRGKAEFVRP